MNEWDSTIFSFFTKNAIRRKKHKSEMNGKCENCEFEWNILSCCFWAMMKNAWHEWKNFMNKILVFFTIQSVSVAMWGKTCNKNVKKIVKTTWMLFMFFPTFHLCGEISLFLCFLYENIGVTFTTCSQFFVALFFLLLIWKERRAKPLWMLSSGNFSLILQGLTLLWIIFQLHEVFFTSFFNNISTTTTRHNIMNAFVTFSLSLLFDIFSSLVSISSLKPLRFITSQWHSFISHLFFFWWWRDENSLLKKFPFLSFLYCFIYNTINLVDDFYNFFFIIWILDGEKIRKK